jgi:DNA-directed RNA polymerase alpha subunit
VPEKTAKQLEKEREKDNSYKWKYERTVANLERALQRISMLDPKGQTANYDFMPEAPLKGTDIYELELSARAMNCLKAAGIKTIEDLCTKTRAELLTQPNLGHGTVRDIVSALYKRNLKLQGDK